MKSDMDLPRNPDYARDGGQYFAFVESIDALDGESLAGREGLPPYWPVILDERHAGHFGVPTHRIWLDCVRRDYFLALDWREQTCARNNVDDSNKRRQLLLDMDPDQFATVLLLMDRRNEGDPLESLQEGSWHRIILSGEKGLPVVAAPDFDLENARLYYVRWDDGIEVAEHRSLLNVFNLEFLLDANLGKPGDSSWPPDGEPPLKEIRYVHSYNQPMWR